MSKVFAGIIAFVSIIMLVLQLAVAAKTNWPVTAVWGLVLVLCAYYLFFKKTGR